MYGIESHNQKYRKNESCMVRVLLILLRSIEILKIIFELNMLGGCENMNLDHKIFAQV